MLARWHLFFPASAIVISRTCTASPLSQEEEEPLRPSAVQVTQPGLSLRPAHVHNYCLQPLGLGRVCYAAIVYQ